ncbi:hypothetical protein Bca52824_075137 [Brassica carinata]|uniref:Gnk2-homologous domain-containing protein n=1 Tax=Brassica carinata TaxID=52824 RepID=A0A8X7PSF0_BRACI|nr:hypothetical protein Bca52824_075137 [Brassica carinata]
MTTQEKLVVFTQDLDFLIVTRQRVVTRHNPIIELLLKIPLTWDTTVQTRQLIPATAPTSPILEPSCLLSLPKTPPTPQDHRVPKCHRRGFQNATVGEDPDMVNGLFLCWGDVSAEVCRNCVAFVVKDTLDRCPEEEKVVLYYDQCMVRYSNRNILSTVNTEGSLVLKNTKNVTSNQKDRFRDLVLSTLNPAAVEAASSSRKFDARKANWTASQTLYGLVQCTPDLSREDCLSCLQQSINQLSIDRTGERFVVPSCSARYELYLFYNESATIKPSPPPQLLSTPPQPEKGGSSTGLVVAIVVAIMVAVLLFIAGYCFLAKGSNKAYHISYALDVVSVLSIFFLHLRVSLCNRR